MNDKKDRINKNEKDSTSNPDASKQGQSAPRYEKPRVKIYAPLHELTFLTAIGATGVGVITSVSGGGH